MLHWEGDLRLHQTAKRICGTKKVNNPCVEEQRHKALEADKFEFEFKLYQFLALFLWVKGFKFPEPWISSSWWREPMQKLQSCEIIHSSKNEHLFVPGTRLNSGATVIKRTEMVLLSTSYRWSCYLMMAAVTRTEASYEHCSTSAKTATLSVELWAHLCCFPCSNCGFI